MRKTSYEEVSAITQRLLGEFKSELRNIEFIVGISRGGLFPAMVVSTAMVKPLVVAYIDKQDGVYFDRAEWIEGRNVLLVDDIVRTGKTIHKIKDLLLEKGALSVTMLTPYYLKEALPRRGSLFHL
jgi:adenine/guanine phosphoribosyltransferase-like PRPP-binding protein